MLSSSPGGSSWQVNNFDFDHDYQRLGLGAYYYDSNPDLRAFKRAGGKLLVAQGGTDLQEISGSAVIDYFALVERVMGGTESTADFFRLFIVPGMNHCTGGEGAFAIDYLRYLEDWIEHGQAPERMIAAHPEPHYLRQLAGPALEELGIPKETTSPADLEAWGAFLMMWRYPLDDSVPVMFTRPVFPYPSFAKFVGHGDPNRAENFAATHVTR
jgi:feruloyl esterase